MDIRKVLEELGYQTYHTNILLCLLQAEKYVTAKEIAINSEVPLSRVYSILIELEKQGLVRSHPGKKTMYSLVEKKEFLQQVGKKKSLDLEKQKEKMEVALQLLGKNLEITSKSPETAVRHFLNDSEYWEVYNTEVAKMDKGDTYRIINSARWALSVLPSEVEQRPTIKSMIVNDLEKHRAGLKFHHMVNPDMLVKTIMEDLKDKKKVAESLAQLLYYYSLPEIMSNEQITIAPEFRNILIVITKDSTFFEFYAPRNHTKILSAVQIKSKDITRDFAAWFDSYSDKKHIPEQDYREFKAAVLASAEKIAKIKAGEIEKLISVMRPVYG